jgi:murein DD-endopeptidase MepM/ murein hydrolase activator NlpD
MNRRSLARPLALALAASTFVACAAILAWPEPEPAAPEALAVVLTPQVLPEPPPTLRRETVEFRSRDTFIALLLRSDVAPASAHEIVAMLRSAGAKLRRVRPGDRLELSHDAGGRLVSLGYAPSPWVRFELADTGSGWKVDRLEAEREVRIEAREGEVRRSLWDAVEGGAVSPQVLLDFVQIFESEVDFTADTRPGDRLRFLVETHYADGVQVDYGRILAAQYIGDGQTLTGVGFQGAKRFAYYDVQGRTLRKAFLRSPLQFTRISSGFTYRRPHPILGGVRPHLAIDYAAPAGTPVWAVADGIVQFAGRNRGNGIQVLLRHRSGYETYYNHLSRIGRGVRSGARVSQKQVIGYVGSTGLSTGPHLDYRVSRHGRFVNPLSEKFLPGEPIAKAQRAQFMEYARALVERLEQEAPFSALITPTGTTVPG